MAILLERGQGGGDHGRCPKIDWPTFFWKVPPLNQSFSQDNVICHLMSIYVYRDARTGAGALFNQTINQMHLYS